MEALHGCLSTSFLQGVNDPLFEGTPVVEGFDPQEVDQREKLFNLVLAAAEISIVTTPSSIRDLHRSAGEAPPVIAFELKAGLRTLSRPILDCVCFI